jgi:predicted enzyme related to lactoylglutathione lyase
VIERDRYPVGVPCWIDATQPDAEAAAAFYGGLFGWEFEDRTPADGAGGYLVALLRGLDVAAVGGDPGGAGSAAAWNTYVAVESADAAVAAARRAGGIVVTDPVDVGDAGRMAALTDPSGARFRVWQAGRHPGARLVNAPGTWNWSDLSTPDPEGAKAFYGALFGWHAQTVQFGEGVEGTMWRLPGYADFLATIDPGLRVRHAEQGVPEGFSDAVAWLLAIAGDDGPARWGVTFAVDGTDAVADRAASLGGAVVAAPFDAGPTRVAVLADPQGAVFTVSTYQPAAG